VLGLEEEQDLRASAVRQAAPPIQANRTALERRAAAARPQPLARQAFNPLRGLIDGLARGLRRVGSFPSGVLEAAQKVGLLL